MMSLWDALRMNMMISYQELVRTFPKGSDVIAYKGAKFKVNKADNSSISYTIISGFDKAVTF